MRPVLIAAALAVLVGCTEGSLSDSVDGGHTTSPEVAVQSPEPDMGDCDQYDKGTEDRGQCLALEEGYGLDSGADTFVVAYRVCSAFTAKEFVRQGFGPSEDPFDAAHTYATEMYDEGFDVIAERGCLTGFEDAGQL